MTAGVGGGREQKVLMIKLLWEKNTEQKWKRIEGFVFQTAQS